MKGVVQGESRERGCKSAGEKKEKKQEARREHRRGTGVAKNIRTDE